MRLHLESQSQLGTVVPPCWTHRQRWRRVAINEHRIVRFNHGWRNLKIHESKHIFSIFQNLRPTFSIYFYFWRSKLFRRAESNPPYLDPSSCTYIQRLYTPFNDFDSAGNSEKEINGWHIRGTLIHHRIIELQHHHRLTLFIDQNISSVYILKEKERKRISFKKENHIYRLAVDEPCELTSWTSAIHGTFEVENIVVLPIELTL